MYLAAKVPMTAAPNSPNMEPYSMDLTPVAQAQPLSSYRVCLGFMVCGQSDSNCTCMHDQPGGQTMSK